MILALIDIVNIEIVGLLAMEILEVKDLVIKENGYSNKPTRMS